ncbi:MAG: GTPase [Pirellulales bacterium]
MVDHLACRLTAPLPSAIATIAVRGPSVHKVIASILDCNDSDDFWTVNRIRFLKWPISDGLAEHVVVCRIANDEIEIHCHGGVAVTDAILSRLRSVGCETVDSERYFPPLPDQTPQQRIENLCQQALLLTRSDRAVGILLDQMHGVQYKCLSRIQDLLRSKRWLEARNQIERLTRWFELADRLCKPWQVILAGPPNVGKSSLINALAGQTISIVHHEAGTTRDWIESETMMDGWPVVLTDTAGIRETDHHIEREGVLRAQQQIASADLVILVVDSTIGWTTQHDQIIETIDSDGSKIRHKLIAWNKCDLPESLPTNDAAAKFDCAIVACSSQQEPRSACYGNFLSTSSRVARRR